MSANQSDWDSGHAQVSALSVLHRLLRGKYIIAIVLAFAFGAAGGAAGYKSRQPQYESIGLIRIKPVLPKVLYESEQSVSTNMFSSFVNTQAELISRGGVIQRALESDEWRAVSHLSELQTAFQVRKNLRVRSSTSAQEIITVSYEDENPQVSVVLVKAIMDSYLEEFGKQGSIKNPAILEALTRRKSNLLKERDSLDSEITTSVQKYGTENLSPLINNALFKVQQLELRRQVLVDQQDIYAQFNAASDEGEAQKMTAEEAALIDPRIAELVSQHLFLMNSRDDMMISEGLGVEHRDVKRVISMVNAKQHQIDQRLEELQSGGSSSVLVDEAGIPIPSPEVLEFRIERIDAQLEVARRNSDDLYSVNGTLSTLGGDRMSIQDSIAEVTRRLDQINTESLVEEMNEISGKISIALDPVRAHEPTSDPRLKMAAAGFVVLGSLPVMAILAIGFLSHRIQYSDDGILSSSGAGIIGMLPDLGNSLSDVELATASAFAVHQIRSQLQISNTSDGTQIFGVTSPAPQDGKTSLIIALGLSFAESGDRTLLVDLDFIGRGLSLHFGYPDAPSLADSLESPTELEELTCDTEFEGLKILPAGFGDDERVSRLSPRSVGALVDHIRDQYDTVLIDTGPILGSVEAAFVTPQADGVILVIGRGQLKPLVKKAIDQIHAVNGKISATIFNRALIQELRQSSSSMSVHFSRQMSRQQEERDHKRQQWGGPVAGALFTSSSKPQKEVEKRLTQPEKGETP